MNNLVAQNNYSAMPQHSFADFDGNYNYVGTDPRLGGRPRPSIRMSGGLNVPGAPGNNNIQQLPYFGGALNPTTMPYVFGQDYGGPQNLPYITATPSFEIPGGQSPYRFGPYLPYRGEEKREEEMPFIPLPLQQAQGLPMGFQNKYVS